MQLKKKGMKFNILTDNLPGLIKRIAIPASIGFFFMTMYNVVDTFFAGMISTNALAAMTLCFPLFIVILALGNGIGTGTSALVTNSIGAGKEKEARRYVSQAISFGIIVSVSISVLGLLFSKSVFRLMNATPEVISLAQQYAVVLFAGATFFIMTYILNSVLMARGDTKSFRNVLIGGFFLNILLDPLFLFGWFGLPKLGLTGIALATILIQAASMIYLLIKVLDSGLFSLKEFTQEYLPVKKFFRAIAKQGFPASVNHLSMAVGMFIITYFLARFSTAAVAAVGISMRLEQIAVMPAIGLNIATITLVGQNNGAKQFARVKETVRLAIRYGFLFTLSMSILVFIFARHILSIFTSDPAVLTIAITAARVASLYISAYIVYGVSISALQAMKRPYFALWGSLGRQLIGPLIFFPLFAYVFGWGLSGIFWGMFVIAWTMSGIALLYTKRVFHSLRD